MLSSGLVVFTFPGLLIVGFHSQHVTTPTPIWSPSDIKVSLINVSNTHRVAITIKGILYSYALEDTISISCTSASLEEHDRQ